MENIDFTPEIEKSRLIKRTTIQNIARMAELTNQLTKNQPPLKSQDDSNPDTPAFKPILDKYSAETKAHGHVTSPVDHPYKNTPEAQDDDLAIKSGRKNHYLKNRFPSNNHQ